MIRIMSCAFAILLTATPALAEGVSFLLCEYESLGEEQQRKIQSIPLYYDQDELVAIGNRTHCIDDPEYSINDTYATWRCITAQNENHNATKSIYVEVNRFTGRYHRNDFAGHYNDNVIEDIWHGVCTPYHEARF